jgi:response regulator RpfG family c-di-GMP phosphodiesterase
MMRLLIVDDEPGVLQALQRSLRTRYRERLQIRTCADPLAALALVRAEPFDIVLSDLRMAGADGIEFLSLVAAVLPASVRMLLTGTADFSTAQRAITDAGVFRYLCKPWTDVELFAHIDAAIQQAVMQRAAAPAEPPLSPQEIERRRLEKQEPGLTEVQWGPTGEVLMPPLPDTQL